MSVFFIHAVVYLTVNVVVVVVWTVFTGSPKELGDIVAQPSLAIDGSFWPIWSIVVWGAALLIHGATALVGFVSPSARRKRRERQRREQQRRRMERKMERGRARGEELLSKTANVALDQVSTAVESMRSKREAPDPAGENQGTEPGPRAAPRWVAVMFTDIADSTSLAESLGDKAWSEILLRHRRLVRKYVAKHDGEEIGTQGDGFLVRYDSPTAAVDSAVAIQRALDKERDTDGSTPELRIGVHVGDTLHDDDGDLVGHVVNLAARVTGAADPGQILITEPVADRLGRGTKLEDCGLQELRGVSRPRHLLAVVWE